MTDTEMHQHARFGRWNILELLISDGGNVFACDIDGKTPAHLAARWKQPDALKVLLRALKPQDRTALVDTRDKEGNTVTYHAALGGCAKCVEQAIQVGWNLSLTNRDGKTPLMAAAGKGHEPAAKCLLDGIKAGEAETLSYVNTKDKAGMTAMHHAASNGHSAVIKLLTSRGGDRRIFDSDGKTPVHCAAGGTQPIALRALLEDLDSAQQTALVNLCCDNMNCTRKSVLHVTVQGGCLECFDIVRQAGGKMSAGRHHNERPLLTVAAEYGNLEVVRRVLDNFVEKSQLFSKEGYVNRCNLSGTTALHHAAMQGHADIVEVLIGHGAERQGPQHRDNTSPLMWAVSNKHPSCAKALLRGVSETEQAALANMCDRNGFSVLMEAVKGGCTDCIDIVHRAGATLTKADRQGTTPLIEATTKGDVSAAKHLLDIFNEGREDKTKLEFINMQDSSGRTAMHFAASKGHADILRLLIDAGGDIAGRENRDGTSMIFAAANGAHLDCIDVLYRAGAKLSTAVKRDDGWTLLILMVRRNSVNVVSHMLDIFKEKVEGVSKTAYIDTQVKDGTSALHYAAMTGYVDVMETLVRHGADTGSLDDMGRTPLHLAASYNQLEALEFFLRRLDRQAQTALVQSCNKYGTSVLGCAVSGGGCFDCIDVVYRAGGKLSDANCDGSTPLMSAASEGYVEVVSRLLVIFDEGKEGMSRLEYMNMRDKNGRTAMHCAAKAWALRTFEFLRDRGADQQLRDDNGETASELAVKSRKELEERPTLFQPRIPWQDRQATRRRERDELKWPKRKQLDLFRLR